MSEEWNDKAGAGQTTQEQPSQEPPQTTQEQPSQEPQNSAPADYSAPEPAEVYKSADPVYNGGNTVQGGYGPRSFESFGSQNTSQNGFGNPSYQSYGSQQAGGYTQNNYSKPDYNNTNYNSTAYTNQQFGTPQMGYAVPPQYAYNGGNAAQKKEGEGFGIASLVLGILSVLLFCTCINFVMAIIAIILGIIQVATQRKKGPAVAGIILSAISIVVGIIFWVVFYGSLVRSAGGWEEFLEEYGGEEYDDLKKYDSYDNYDFDDFGNYYEYNDADDNADEGYQQMDSMIGTEEWQPIA